MHLLGVFNRDVSPADVAELSAKLGLHAKEAFAVGCDSRAGSFPFKLAALSGLLSAGCNAVDLGAVPSPVVAKTARDERIWGLHASADPYPSDYVGIKVYNPSGRAWEGDLRTSYNGVRAGSISRMDLSPDYSSQLLAEHDIEPMKIVVDCANGPTGRLVPAILRSKGCQVLEINSSPSPSPLRGYEPAVSNIKDLRYMVSRTGADLGVAFDGSGSKASFVAGPHFLSSSRALGLIMKFNGFRRAVVDVGASSVLDEVGYVDRLPASEVAIAGVLEERGVPLGGGTMGVIFSEWSFAPDAIYLMMEVLSLVSDQGVRLKELNDALPQYFEDAVMVRAGNPGNAVENATQALNENELDLRDGVKAFLDGGWLWIKPMKGFVRIAAEAESRQKVKEFIEFGRNAVKPRKF